MDDMRLIDIRVPSNRFITIGVMREAEVPKRKYLFLLQGEGQEMQFDNSATVGDALDALSHLVHKSVKNLKLTYDGRLLNNLDQKLSSLKIPKGEFIIAQGQTAKYTELRAPNNEAAFVISARSDLESESSDDDDDEPSGWPGSVCARSAAIGGPENEEDETGHIDFIDVEHEPVEEEPDIEPQYDPPPTEDSVDVVDGDEQELQETVTENANEAEEEEYGQDTVNDAPDIEDQPQEAVEDTVDDAPDIEDQPQEAVEENVNDGAIEEQTQENVEEDVNDAAEEGLEEGNNEIANIPVKEDINVDDTVGDESNSTQEPLEQTE
jgi:hypothetical protein